LKKVVIIGSLDTKEAEAKYLKDRLKELHLRPFILDVSMRQHKPEILKSDIRNEEVAAAGGSSIERVGSLELAEAIKIMVEGATEILRKLYDKGEISGVVGYGGSVGLTVSTTVMKALPFGVPKLVVTSLSADAGRFIGHKDIAVVPSITDMAGGKTVNRIEGLMLTRAAGAMAGMVKAEPPSSEEKPFIVASQFGVTTPQVRMCKELLEDIGYEVAAFHAVGTGGRSMEETVENGLAAGVLDITTHELADRLVGGVYDAGPTRLETAGRLGVPQVILPGALDIINFWRPETVPERFKNRRFYYHNPNVTLMRTSVEESRELGKIVADKVNKAKGPTVVVIPLKGWSSYDVEGGVTTVDYYGKPTGEPWYQHESNAAFTKALEDRIDRSKQNVELLKVDYHINDRKLSELLTTILDDTIKDRWKKGTYIG